MFIFIGGRDLRHNMYISRLQCTYDSMYGSVLDMNEFMFLCMYIFMYLCRYIYMYACNVRKYDVYVCIM